MGQCSVENTEADTTQVKWIIIIEVQIAMGGRGRIVLLSVGSVCECMYKTLYDYMGLRLSGSASALTSPDYIAELWVSQLVTQ